MQNEETVIEQTRRWITEVVIGLNLCPFARRVFDGGLIRFAVTDAGDGDALRTALTHELKSLADAPTEQVETAILIHPHALGDFLDYNDFVIETESLLEELELTGVIQIAGFHPQYQFGGTRPGDAENYTNRSPFPMLHLLREDSITAVNDDPERLLEIPRRNVETLRRMGKAQILKLLGRVTS